MARPQNGEAVGTVCSEWLMWFSKHSWRWVLSSLCKWGCRGLQWLRGSPKGHQSELDPRAIWHHSPSKLCCRAASLQSAHWWRMRAHCPNSRCFCIVSLNRALFSLCLPVRMKQRRWVVGAGTFWLFKGDLPPASYCPSRGKGLKLVGAFSPTPRPGISRPKAQASW